MASNRDRTPSAAALSSRMARGELLAPDCPSREVLKHVTSRWGVLVLIVLLKGTHRFSELRRRVGGVSEKMLAQTLQWLEDDGLVVRKSFPVVPPHVEYSLSPMGVEAAQQVRSLADWIEENVGRILVAQNSTPRAAKMSGVRTSAVR